MGRLGQLRAGRQVTVFSDLIVGYYVFTVRLGGRPSGNAEVPYRIIGRYPVYDLQLFDIPANQLR
ncbi:hypothetical protein D9M69_568310 [compost metagenome]